MNAVAWLIVLCCGWGFLLGYLFGRAEGRDSMRPKRTLP